MRMFFSALLLATFLRGGFPAVTRADELADLLQKSLVALDQGARDKALALANQAVKLGPQSPQAYLVRGLVHDFSRRSKDAVTDFDKAIQLDPKAAEAYDHRGSAHFKLGNIKGSLADFDSYLKLKPDKKPGHWRRGITCYYAGQFEEGYKQFAAYEKVDTNDVENAVWHYLCLARVGGAAKARAALLKIGKDRRIPLMEVYDLFAGKAKPEDVLKAANAGKPSPQQLKGRLFYAHLYLGLWYESEGDAKKSLEHMTKAAGEFGNEQYMGDVARVHVQLRGKEAKKK